VDDAVSQALRQLGLKREEVDIEVIKQGSRGLLGLLSEDAVVRVTPRPWHDPLPEAETEAEPEEVELPSRPSPAPQQEAESRHLAGEEIAGIGAEVLQNLLGGLDLKTRVTAEETPPGSQNRPDSVYLNISGDGLGVLIGRRGATLNDLQYLTCLLVSRRVQRWPDLVVDVERYKARREKSLVELAKRMAERVRTTAQPLPLEPMPPNERRIVHLALRDDPNVYTESSGEDEERKVVIRPKK
jgi:spoIIIJ-associated protein